MREDTNETAMQTLRVHTPLADYPIWIGRGLLDSLGERLDRLHKGRRALVLTDRNVDALYGDRAEASLKAAGWHTGRLAVEPGERSKSVETLMKVYGALLDHGCTRSDMLVALGGGVVGDLGGFAAATYLRGIPFVQVPTTLLAQVDSAVGGKTGINLPRGKNLAGSFTHPLAVLSDQALLDTLPKRELCCGMAEVIKYGLIRDSGLLRQLWELGGSEALRGAMADIVRTCCRIKSELVEEDEHDRGNRMLLNFGHTLGHAVEVCQHYGGFNHGEAVAVGMYQITRLSEAKGLTEPGSAEAVRTLLERFGLPRELEGCEEAALTEAVRVDKKNLDGALRLVLLKRPGEARLYETDAAFFSGLCAPGLSQDGKEE
jgi:3-dehydroquinate synthase